MSSQTRIENQLVLTPPEAKQLMPIEIMAQLLQTHNPKDAVEAMKELAKLQLEMQRQDAEVAFNDSMNRCQDEIKRVVPDTTGANSKKFASFKALDKETRPVYVRHGFALSWDTAECSIPDHVLVVCYVSKGLYTRRYQIPIDASGKGAKGGDVMDKPKAMGAALSYGKRYLLGAIFNIAIGEEDQLTNGELMEAVEWIENANSQEERKKMYAQAYNKFEASPEILKVIIAANRKRKEELDRDGR